MFLCEIGVLCLELPDFAVGAPTQITVTGVAQVGPRYGLEAPRSVEARRQLVSERLVLNKLVVACRLDGRFVQALGVQLSAFDAGDLSVHQLRAALDLRKTAARVRL
jgi:hypothetical protein